MCVRVCVSDLSELLKGQLVAAAHQLLGDLPDLVTRQTQVGGLEQLVELFFADETIVVQVWTSRGKR